MVGWSACRLRSSLSKNWRWGFPSALCRPVVAVVRISGEDDADFSS